MRRRRITVLGLMGLVLGSGIALHMGLAALRVSSAKEYHGHTWVHVQGGKPFFTLASAEQPPFWPRYWRYLLGVRWKGLPMCRTVEGRLLDTCEVAHPEIRKSGVGDRIEPTGSQIDLMRRLKDSAR